jgi:hypothetical protein
VLFRSDRMVCTVPVDDHYGDHGQPDFRTRFRMITALPCVEDQQVVGAGRGVVIYLPA